ncbi:hypothetical protein U9M48_042397, partial [Paspalum notatum var. saurae]
QHLATLPRLHLLQPAGRRGSPPVLDQRARRRPPSLTSPPTSRRRPPSSSVGGPVSLLSAPARLVPCRRPKPPALRLERPSPSLLTRGWIKPHRPDSERELVRKALSPILMVFCRIRVDVH